MTVVNKRTHTPTANDVYIGRGSKWGNPFRIGELDADTKQPMTREIVITRYRQLMNGRLNREDAYSHDHFGDIADVKWTRDLLALHDKTLVCYCKPQACHGDVLEQLIEELMNDER
jgi:hypothetical protein